MNIDALKYYKDNINKAVVSYYAFKYRVLNGWDPEKALTTTAHGKKYAIDFDKLYQRLSDKAKELGLSETAYMNKIGFSHTLFYYKKYGYKYLTEATIEKLSKHIKMDDIVLSE